MQRFLVEKKPVHNREAIALRHEMEHFLGFHPQDVRVIAVYDLYDVDESEGEKIFREILWDPVLDVQRPQWDDTYQAYRYEAVDGQYDQRGDVTGKLASLLMGRDTLVLSSRIVLVKGLTEEEMNTLKAYHLNAVEYVEVPLDRDSYRPYAEATEPIPTLAGFRKASEDELVSMTAAYGLGMDLDDLLHIQRYFDSIDRDPTETELKLLETYWSDHCRHTTFNTVIDEIRWNDEETVRAIGEAFQSYVDSRGYVFGDQERPLTLMDLATINAREVTKKGLLDDKEKSDEVNAASIEIDIEVDGRPERWLLMFKNETHNHPTEIEPFGGASTCLGGAIRDPLSGRAYVYQAIRITGCGNPLTSWEDTLEGKLPQRKITLKAMEGYSSYGYQIGATTGALKEVYHDGFVAKRMELGALVAAAPKAQVTRGKAMPGDVVILLGGRTGRDGLGAAVGSSKKHTEDSLDHGGTDVQKGNPLIERRIVRLFRRPEASKLIKVCNDFGAGGVSVAIGELADGLLIQLDAVPVKYPGMNGTEIALSESQERMAVVIAAEDVAEFMQYAAEEACDATIVAEVTEDPVVKMMWRGQEIVRIDRSFIDTNGVQKHTTLEIRGPEGTYFETKTPSLEHMKSVMGTLEQAYQGDMTMSFDASVGGGTVLLPYGGINRLTPTQGMVAILPVEEGETDTCSIMSYGYNPKLASWSPFHGGYYAVLESLARMTAMGGDASKARLTFQEYFERLGNDPEKWGKPFQALLGAFLVQKAFDTPAIGGKDSMSGTFEELHVPPTLVSFAVGTTTVDHVVSPELKAPGRSLVWLHLDRNEDQLVDLEQAKKAYKAVYELVRGGHVYAAMAVEAGGIYATVAKMALGNGIGVKLNDVQAELWGMDLHGDLLLEMDQPHLLSHGIELGITTADGMVTYAGETLSLETLTDIYIAPLKPVFEGGYQAATKEVPAERLHAGQVESFATGYGPQVLIPVFFGSHGEYSLKKQFLQAGAEVRTFIFDDRDPETYPTMVEQLAIAINGCNILAFPDGCVYGQEPEVAGKFMENLLHEHQIMVACQSLLARKGLILGIGDSFTGLLHAGYFEEELGAPTTMRTSYHARGRFTHTLNHVKVQTNDSPWLCLMKPGDMYTVPVATQMGRFEAEDVEALLEKGLVGTRFIGRTGEYENSLIANPTGSMAQIESLLSPNKQVFGTIAAIDRVGTGLYQNRENLGLHQIFASAVHYFKGE